MMSRRKNISSEYQAWTIVALWVVVLFLTVPVARILQTHMRSAFGDSSFGYIVITIAAASALYLIFHLYRQHTKPQVAQIIWIVICTGLIITYTIKLWANPIEAFHFIQYGVLAGLLFIALSWKHSNVLIYLLVILATSIVGIVDEGLQWLMPNRVWGLSDIGINCMAGIIVSLAIAMGVRPSFICKDINLKSIQLVISLSIVIIILLLLSLMNTPNKIGWYSDRIPGLSFLADNGHIMVEYGYRYDDEDIGLFRSRFRPDRLKKVDYDRAKEAALKLDSAPLLSDYRQFIKHYSPIRDPFLHELRVHLNRRDYYFKTAQEVERYTLEDRQRRWQIAYYENKIVEKYFLKTLSASSFQLSQQERKLIKDNVELGEYYESPVSNTLITGISQTQMLYLLLIVLGGLIIWRFKLSARSSHVSL